MRPITSIKTISLKLPVILIIGFALSLAAPACLAQATGKLNDSGVVTCANAVSNEVACSYADSDLNGFPRQDGQIGRSPKESVKGVGAAPAQLPKTGASWSKGFDFTKLDYTNASALAATALQGTTVGTWGCTRDNVTGLIWDMKVATASNLRLSNNTYTWKKSSGDNGDNVGVTGGAAGSTCFTSACDTEAYITYTNATLAAKVCGYTNWRLPTRAELLTIADASPRRYEIVKPGVTGSSLASTITVPDTTGLFQGLFVIGDDIATDAIIVSISGTTVTLSRANTSAVTGSVTFSQRAAVDPTYFPHVRVGNFYWTSDTNSENPAEARFVNFAYGVDGVASKGDTLHVILVRP